ncbi:MAG: TIGR02452 family protein [Clostridiales bacterium]|nr:TIGR02452 family protein [Clostridiales bacterium]
MSERKTKEISDEEKLKQMAAQMRALEYKGLSEEEIWERERQKEARRKKNIEILNDTLNILKKGCYTKDCCEVRLRFSPEQLREAQVFLPDDIESLRTSSEPSVINDENIMQGVDCYFGCENADALVLAKKEYQNLKKNGETAPQILVLNLASAAQPGGQTEKGAAAQEEDLCRRTSLLLSLKSENAKKYYEYNKARKTRMGSDAIILSPYVEVVKDTSSETLDAPFPISVISCGAPMIRLGPEGMSQQEYEEMLFKRIQGILLVAASKKYRHLILGAFGCGVYGNDAALVSDLFARAICSFTYGGKSCRQLFASIKFAVLCKPGKDYNYKEFSRNFSSGKQLGEYQK